MDGNYVKSEDFDKTNFAHFFFRCENEMENIIKINLLIELL